jgi:hypothetical protein
LGVSPHADSGLHVCGKFGAAKEEGVDIICQHDLFEDSPLDHEIEAGIFEFLFEAEELLEQAGLFRVGWLESEG